MPHVIAQLDRPAQKVVVVGAGPAGLEAARVSAERGHAVILFEAAAKPGGQIRLAARVTPAQGADRHRRLACRSDCERLGVEMRFNTLAEAADVRRRSSPISSIVATGGLPQSPPLEEGDELQSVELGYPFRRREDRRRMCWSTTTMARIPAWQAAEMIAEAGSALEIVSPERFFAPEMGGLNHVSYAEAFHRAGVRITIRLPCSRAVRREGNKLAACDRLRLWTASRARLVDQVVVEHGTLPLDDFYFALKEQSINRGEVDYLALIAGRPQQIVRQSRWTLPAVPDRRCGLFAEYPRRHLRRASAVQGVLRRIYERP